MACEEVRFWGISWRDIDLSNKEISISQVLISDGGKPTLKECTKNGERGRTISINNIIVKAIKKHMIHKFRSKNLVFTTSTNTPISPQNFLRSFKNDIKKLDLPQITFHDLRHTHATLLLKKGENIKVISERLGHSKSSFTMDVYSHVTPDMQQRAAEKIESILN